MRRPTRRHVLATGAAMAGAFASRGTLAAGDTAEITLRAAPSTQQLGPPAESGPASIWGYQGQVPGPELRVTQGSRVRARLVNALEQPTTIHWHGVRIENAMDGVANLTQAPVPPGGEFVYDFTVPDAGTYWYHPHNRTWEQMARGLYGPLIVEETEPPQVDRDLVLMLDDWRLTGEGVIDEESFGSGHDWSHAGRLGNWPTVNGAPQPDYPVEAGERLRLRLVNAANATVLTLRLDGVRAWRVAADGMPTAPDPVEGEIVLAPAQRLDLFADVTGEAPRLMIAGRENFRACGFPVTGRKREEPLPPPDRLPANPMPRTLDTRDALTLEMRIEGGAMSWLGSARVGERAGYSSGNEAPAGPLSGRELAERRLFWALNGVSGMPGAPLFDVARGRTVAIRMVNEGRFPHAMHVHGHHALQASTGVWRDTVLVGPQGGEEIAFVADNPGAWMLHCHMLEHQAAGMATWFRVRDA